MQLMSYCDGREHSRKLDTGQAIWYFPLSSEEDLWKLAACLQQDMTISCMPDG